MRLMPRSLSDILHPTPTPTPNFKRDSPAPACHGIGCLSVPVPAATTDCSGDACGVKAGKAPPPTSTVTITNTDYITIHVNVTFYSTSWLTAYDTILSTVQNNITVTQTKTETQNFTSHMTDMHTATATATQLLDTGNNSTIPVPVQQQKGGFNSGDIVAILLGVVVVVMALGGFLMYRGLSRKRREERVLRKQLQTEGTELKDGKNGDGLGESEMQEWEGAER